MYVLANLPQGIIKAEFNYSDGRTVKVFCLKNAVKEFVKENGQKTLKHILTTFNKKSS
jgi:hypothetical protein